MRTKQILLLTVPVALVAIPPLVAAALSFATLKPLADSLMADGNFKSLREDNAPVFRILLGSIGLLLLGVAHLIGSGRIPDVKGWFSQFAADTLRFCRAIKPSRGGRVSRARLAGTVGAAAVFRLIHLFDEMTRDESYTFVVFASGSLFNTITNYHLPNNHVLNSLLIFFPRTCLGSNRGQ